MADRIAIVGAGYAGMAAAAELAAAGVPVDVFEASRTLGGRARGVDIEGLRLDNGAHILVGAYTETLRLMHLVSPVGATEAALKRLPLHLEFPDHFRIKAPRLPAPLHLAWALLTAQGLSLKEKLATMGFMEAMKRRRFRLDRDMSASELLADQPGAARRYLWDPLCLAALNTPPESASAQVFLNVLRDSLAAGREASDLLLPATDFSSLFPEPAARFVETHGGRVHRGRRIRAIEQRNGAWYLDDQDFYASVILAVAPRHLPALVQTLPELAPIVDQLRAYAWEAIVTVYLAYPETVRLAAAMLGVADGTAQWLFDRGWTHDQPGLIAAVISAHARSKNTDQDTLVTAIHREIQALVPDLPPARWTRVITEKRATFACTPDLQRPATLTPLPGLLLAGDYVAGDYPATLEGAIRSGVAAARATLQSRPAALDAAYAHGPTRSP